MITHPEKVLFPADGITKGELAAYYDDVADVMLPHLRKRPITMERFPAGIEHKGFIQKDVSKGFPDWLKRIEAPKKDGVVHYPSAGDRRSLAWLANQNAVALHIWASRAPSLDHPDVCVFDLDPSQDEPEILRAAAIALRDILKELGFTSWIKTSGSKGFHIAVPLKARTTFDQSSGFAQRVASIAVERDPKHLTLAFSKADRGGRILIDIARNRAGATFVAPYSVRAKAGAPVSAPCSWEEVEQGTIAPQSFNVRTMVERVRKVGDLWLPLTKRTTTGPSISLRASVARKRR